MLVQRVIIKKRAKKCNTINLYKRDNLILGTADLLAETFQMLNDIKDFNFNTKNEKIENITEANELEDKCNHYRSVFEDLTKKLKTQNANIIRRAHKSSMRFSFASDKEFSFVDDGTNNNTNNENDFAFTNGKEFLDGISSKQKQNTAIDQANVKINSISRKSSVQNFLNTLKRGGSGNSLNNEDILLRMESKVFHAIEGDDKTWLQRNYIKIIIGVIIAIVILYFII